MEANLALFNEARDLMNKQGERNYVSLNYGIGNAYLEEGNFDKALEFLNESLTVNDFI